MLVSVVSNKGIDETRQAFVQAITDRKFSVLAIHNLKEKINSKGLVFDPECSVYEICNPQLAQKVLLTEITASTALPCRVSIYTEGNTVKLATLKPTELMGIFGRPDLAEAAKIVEETILDAMQAAAE